MAHSIRKKLLIAAGFALIIAGAAGWLIYRCAAAAADAAVGETRAHEVLAAADRLLAELTAADAHRRAFLKSGASARRELWAVAAAALPGRVDELRRLRTGDDEQQRRIDEAGRRAARVSELVRQLLQTPMDPALPFNDPPPSALTHELKETEAGIAQLMVDVKAAENERLARGDEATRAAAAVTMTVVDAGNLLTLLVVGLTVVGVHRDYVAWRRSEATRQQQAGEQCRRLERLGAIGRLTSGVAHDFNNLLTVMTTGCEATLCRLRPDDPSRECLAVALKACEKAVSLSRRLLSLGRAKPPRPAPLDLNAVVADMERVLRRLMDGVKLDISLDPAARPVLADVARVEQVLLNLLVNARDATPAGGKVRVETRAGGAGVTLTVTDEGCGMDDATKARLFEPFFTTKADGKGTGLGMAVVLDAVRESGGRVEVDSAPGRGAAVRVFLPAASADHPVTVLLVNRDGRGGDDKAKEGRRGEPHD